MEEWKLTQASSIQDRRERNASNVSTNKVGPKRNLTHPYFDTEDSASDSDSDSEADGVVDAIYDVLCKSSLLHSQPSKGDTLQD